MFLNHSQTKTLKANKKMTKQEIFYIKMGSFFKVHPIRA